MDVLSIPFNQFLGIKKAGKEGFYLTFDDLPQYLNHIGTTHASVQFALAEATSGEFLLSEFKAVTGTIVPVVRKAEVKYKKPSKGKLFSKARLLNKDAAQVTAELDNKGRTLLEVSVDIFDVNDVLTMSTVFEWFIQRMG